MLLNILQCTEQPPVTKNYSAQNDNSTEVKKPPSRERVFQAKKEVSNSRLRDGNLRGTFEEKLGALCGWGTVTRGIYQEKNLKGSSQPGHMG